MKVRTLLDNKRRAVGQEIRVELHGCGGELGIKNIQHPMGLIEKFKSMKTEREVNDHYAIIMGYCLRCTFSGFIDEKSADDIMKLVAGLAGNELERVKGAKA